LETQTNPEIFFSFSLISSYNYSSRFTISIDTVHRCSYPSLVIVYLIQQHGSMPSTDAYTSAEDQALAGLSRLSVNHVNGPSQFPPPYSLDHIPDTHTHTIIALHGRGSNGPEVLSFSTSTFALHLFPQDGPKPRDRKRSIQEQYVILTPAVALAQFYQFFRAVLPSLTSRSSQKSSSRIIHRRG